MARAWKAGRASAAICGNPACRKLARQSRLPTEAVAIPALTLPRPVSQFVQKRNQPLPLITLDFEVRAFHRAAASQLAFQVFQETAFARFRALDARNDRNRLPFPPLPFQPDAHRLGALDGKRRGWVSGKLPRRLCRFRFRIRRVNEPRTCPPGWTPIRFPCLALGHNLSFSVGRTADRSCSMQYIISQRFASSSACPGCRRLLFGGDGRS